MEEEVVALRKRVQELEDELSRLRAAQNAATTTPIETVPPTNTGDISASTVRDDSSGTNVGTMHAATREVTCGLSAPEIQRYCRQMLVPSFGATSQQQLKHMKVLIIGAGGLGCPAALYLAAAGAGTIGVIDDDIVDISNLQRQVAHTEMREGVSKAESLCATMSAINSSITCHTICMRLTPHNAEHIISNYDVILDCTDNPGTRYLVNDACVLLGKPLVSGAALGTDGQLSVYNYNSGPCYRCIHPTPPAAANVQSCADAGVLGPVTGVIGCLQAMEVLKIAAARAAVGDKMGSPLSSKLLVFDGADTRFRVVSLRGKRDDCIVCGLEPAICTLDQSQRWAEDRSLVVSDREVCKRALTDEVECPSVTVEEFARQRPLYPNILDVRTENQFAICSLAGSVNIPLSEMQKDSSAIGEFLTRHPRSKCEEGGEPVFVLCRRGVDSKVATQWLRERGYAAYNVTGGLRRYSSKVDTAFPSY